MIGSIIHTRQTLRRHVSKVHYTRGTPANHGKCLGSCTSSGALCGELHFFRPEAYIPVTSRTASTCTAATNEATCRAPSILLICFAATLEDEVTGLAYRRSPPAVFPLRWVRTRLQALPIPSNQPVLFPAVCRAFVTPCRSRLSGPPVLRRVVAPTSLLTASIPTPTLRFPYGGKTKGSSFER